MPCLVSYQCPCDRVLTRTLAGEPLALSWENVSYEINTKVKVSFRLNYYRCVNLTEIIRLGVVRRQNRPLACCKTSLAVCSLGTTLVCRPHRLFVSLITCYILPLMYGCWLTSLVRESMCVMGTSGSGKTSFLNVISGRQVQHGRDLLLTLLQVVGEVTGTILVNGCVIKCSARSDFNSRDTGSRAANSFVEPVPTLSRMIISLRTSQSKKFSCLRQSSGEECIGVVATYYMPGCLHRSQRNKCVREPTR